MTTTTITTTQEKYQAKIGAVQAGIKAEMPYEWQQARIDKGETIDETGGARVLYALEDAPERLFLEDRKPHPSEVARRVWNQSQDVVDLLHWSAGEVVQLISMAPQVIQDHGLTLDDLDLMADCQINIIDIPIDETAPRVLAYHLRAIARKFVESADRLDAVADRIGVPPIGQVSVPQNRIARIRAERELLRELGRDPGPYVAADRIVATEGGVQ